jgi:hypothetical protein
MRKTPVSVASAGLIRLILPQTLNIQATGKLYPWGGLSWSPSSRVSGFPFFESLSDAFGRAPFVSIRLNSLITSSKGRPVYSLRLTSSILIQRLPGNLRKRLWWIRFVIVSVLTRKSVAVWEAEALSIVWCGWWLFGCSTPR